MSRFFADAVRRLSLPALACSAIASALPARAQFCGPSDLYGPPVMAVAPASQRHVSVGDLNGDGIPDLVITTPTNIAVELGARTGGALAYGPARSYATLPNPTGTAIADFDGDGNPDVIVGCAGNDGPTLSFGLVVFHGNGDGTLTEIDRYAYGRISAVAAVDLNRDGLADVIASERNGSMLILFAAGDGGFAYPLESDAAGASQGFAMADLDGDGELDVAAATGSNFVDVLTRATDSTVKFFEYPEILSTSADTTIDVAIGDFDADGTPDLASVGPDGVVDIFLRQAGGVMHIHHELNARASSIRATDVNHDGRPDLLVGLVNGAGAVALFMNAGTAGGADHLLPPVPFGPPGVTASLTIADLDGDGTPDVLAPSAGAGGLPVYSNRCPPDLVTLAVTLAGTGSVRTVPGRTAYMPGEHVTLVATAEPTYRFAGWSGDVASLADSITVVMDGPRFMTASFPPILHELRVQIAGQGDVQRTPSDNPIHEGTTVRLQALPALGYFFDSWAGDAAATSDTLLVSMDRDHSFTARFRPDLAIAPGILSVTDVPGDQGSFVIVRWRPSPFEFVPHDSAVAVTQYVLWKALPPATGAAARAIPTPAPHAAAPGSDWVKIATVHAALAEEYSYVTRTAADSGSGGVPRSTYLIEARDELGLHYWDSPPDSGYSIDNLAPQPPAGLQAVLAGGVATLRWQASTEPDFAAFHIHRGATSDFVPSPANELASQTDTSFVDPHPAGSYYEVLAVDVHGNVGAAATTALEGEALALEAATPNPSLDGRCVVRLVLPTAAPARLMLVDVAGRRVAERELHQAGRQSVALGAGHRIPAGLYWLKLRQGSDERVGRIVVLE